MAELLGAHSELAHDLDREAAAQLGQAQSNSHRRAAHVIALPSTCRNDGSA
jgi:hypothetical protein